MAYQIRYSDRAREYRNTMPAKARDYLDIKLNKIADDPYREGREAKDEGAWYADFGPRYEGMIKYVIGEVTITVSVINITWAG